MAAMTANASAFQTCEFTYPPDNTLEVIIITNTSGDHDGYLELSAAIRLFAPFLNNNSMLWANVAPSHKLIKNNKKYVHVFSLLKYLSNYNLNAKNHPQEYYTIKSVVCDLLSGVQNKQFDPMCEIKTQLCAIQESLNEAIDVLNGHVAAEGAAVASALPPAQDLNNIQELIQTLHAEYKTNMKFTTETILDNIKNIKDLMCLNK
ncbi:p24 [Cyclophragma undans nucleopolyhedrovirus]|uniref:P24 n=1 Tax=Cyclophragma undans nucleopolyhedrovirus TaxID=1906244 RepID=A0A288QA73_9ABAC|nr:p24 [Cyclophragma undans nucleopolyhedrovirus]AOT85495.1 p24 [Cyclophragma undans nucleopolyhedrovirus]